MADAPTKSPRLQLFEVRVRGCIVVLAEDEVQAEEIARDKATDLVEDVELAYDANPLEYLPWGHDGEELPYVDDSDPDVPERTLNQWIDRGAAPKLTARMAAKKTGGTRGTR